MRHTAADHPKSDRLLRRRDFLELVAALGFAGALQPVAASPGNSSREDKPAGYRPGRIPNEYSLFLPGEEEALQTPPTVKFMANGTLAAELAGESLTMRPGEQLQGWRLSGICTVEDAPTAVFEKHVSHRGVIAYVTEHKGVTAYIPKQIGQLANIRPRPTSTPHGVKLERATHFEPGKPDSAGLYILNSAEDPSYENVAALGKEYIGWTLVANEEAGPQRSLYLDETGRSRQLEALSPVLGELDATSAEMKRVWAPDAARAIFDPVRNLAVAGAAWVIYTAPQIYEYVPGYSKRTLLGGYLPVANIGVWNPNTNAGYEVIVLLPEGGDAQPMARLRYLVPQDLIEAIELQIGSRKTPAALLVTEHEQTYLEVYWNCAAADFYAALAGIWKHWHRFHEEAAMQVDIPDEWLRHAAQAGLTLTRCSYRGLEPTYQIGEGPYTKFRAEGDCSEKPACQEAAFSDAIFPVAHYEFVWAQQLWNHCEDANRYFQYYLERYVLSNGELLYNLKQGEAPLNAGVFLANSARSYFYGRNLAAFEQRLPILERMIGFVLERYDYSKAQFVAGDRRRGLIWGSPEADLGGGGRNGPGDHPLYYQNAAWIWRGLAQHAKALAAAAHDSGRDDLAVAAGRYAKIAREMRGLIAASIAATRALGNAEMQAAGLTPFSPDDTNRKVAELANYENHRFMEDWFLADWGDPSLDQGYLKHRDLSGMKVLGLGLSHGPATTSNFMAHGTLSALIRQEDYRPFLLTLYALTCYAADSGNRYSPEDAFIPGGRPLEGDPNWWGAVVNSALQPTLGLRWLLCYEETDRDVCHLQKAAPKHWFAKDRTIAVKHCPTRFGPISWSTHAVGDRQWQITVDVPKGFSADLVIHIHPDDGQPLRSASAGVLQVNKIILRKAAIAAAKRLQIVAA